MLKKTTPEINVSQKNEKRKGRNQYGCGLALLGKILTSSA